MSTEFRLRDRTEIAFTKWARLVIRFRWLAVLAPTALSAFFISFLPQLAIDNSSESFLRVDDPTAIQYRKFRDRFDRDDRIIVALAPENVFDSEFLHTLRLFHLALESELPYVEEITSIFNSRATRGQGDELIVEDLLEGWLEKWPEDATTHIATLRERVFSNPLYIDALVSRDAGLTTLMIKPFTYSSTVASSSDADALSGFGDEVGDADTVPPPLLSSLEADELMATLRSVVDRFEGPNFPIYLGGALPMTDQINRSMAADMTVTMSVSFGVILGILFMLFRRINGAILPVLVVGLSVASAIGIMIMIRIPGSTAVQILPVFLLSVGVCDTVHILTIFYQRIGDRDTREDAIAYAMGHSGLPIVMTSVTTAAGMLSFMTAEMAPIAHLGTIAPIGVMLALAYTLVLLPAILAFIPTPPPKKNPRAGISRTLTRGLVAIGDFSATHATAVLVATAVFVGICGVGIPRARFSHLATSWFEKGDPIREAAILLDAELRGTMNLEVVLDTGRENGLHEPEVLQRIEAAMRHAETLDKGGVMIGKATSIVDVVKETHRALNENRTEFYRIPDDRQTIAQELLLFENAGAEDLQELVDTRFQTARVSLRTPFVDALLYGPFIEYVRGEMSQILGPDIEIEMTGFMPVLAGVMSAMIVSMARSYVFALVIITPLMIFLLRDIRLGLVSMIPNLIPVIFTIGLMGWLDIPIDGTTMMIGAMVIGLAVDDTIHFLHKYRIYMIEYGDSRKAIRTTLESTGAALLFTTLVLSAGFGIFVLADMINTQNFGLLASAATCVAFLADIIVAPAILTLLPNRAAASASLLGD